MDQQTINSYNKFAQKYDEETHDFWERFPRTFFDKFIELTQGNVLDVGSGPGRDARILRERNLKVTCLDASATMVAMTTQDGFESLIGDFADLPFGDRTFGGVWAYTSLLHVPKLEIHKAMEEIHRVLRPGGIFGLGLIEGTTEEYRESPKVPERRWFSFYTQPEVEKLLISHGFEIVYFEQFKPNTKNYLNFIARVV